MLKSFFKHFSLPILFTCLLGTASAFASSNSAMADNTICQSTTSFCDGYVIVNEDKVRLHYLTGGKGPALLLIPGWPQTVYTWHKIMPELAKHFTVIAVDPRGIGDSNRPLTGYGMAV